MRLLTLLSLISFTAVGFLKTPVRKDISPILRSALQQEEKKQAVEKISQNEPLSVDCNTWLNMPDKLCGVTVGDLDVSGNQLTVEAMCNATDVYNLSRTLVSKHEDPRDVNYLLTPDVAQITTSNGFYSVSSSCGFNSNKTYHVAMVYDGITLKIYRNGFLMGSVPATGNLILNNWPTTIGEYAYSMYFGLANISNIFKGYINEVRIWNVARTQAQIRAFMNDPLPNPSSQTGLLGYYTFDNLVNKQGNSLFNGTIQGTSTINNSNPNCTFSADSCSVPSPLDCTDNSWLKITNDYDYAAIGDLDIPGNTITVEAAFNADTNYFIPSTVAFDLVSKHTNPANCNYLLRPVSAEITTTNGFYQVLVCDYQPKKINHAALVYDGSTLKLYRNGHLMGSKPASGNLVLNDLVTKIGNYAALSRSEALKGYINEVRIWNVARTAEQINTYMYTTLPDPTTQAGLVAYYNFNNLQNKQGNSSWNASLAGTASINTAQPDCSLVADSCYVAPVNPCQNWLKVPDKLCGATVGFIDVTGNQLTVEAKCNATDVYNLSRALVSKHEYPGDVNYFLTPDIAQITTTNGFYSVGSTCGFESNKTYHVAMVYNGATLKIYRNGFLMGTVPATGNLINNGWPTTIGEYAYSMYYGLANISNVFKGYINDVRIWNVARTQQQIQTYMNSPLPDPTTQTGLLGYYTFDNLTNKQGNTLFNGTLKGTATIQQINPQCSFTADSCLVVVPVQLSMFTATVTGNTRIALNWRTADEVGITGYTVERSQSANGPFTAIGTVNAHNYGTQNEYSLNDLTAQPGTRYFYRLKITENSGTVKYSAVREAAIRAKGFFVNVYPNPVANIISVQIANADGAVTVNLFNNLGQKLITRTPSITNNGMLNIEARQLPAGTYWLEVSTSKERIIKKIDKL